MSGWGWPDMRAEMQYQGVTFQAWPEHGCWYEKGRADRVGALYVPMGVDGPVFADMGEVEVLWKEA